MQDIKRLIITLAGCASLLASASGQTFTTSSGAKDTANETVDAQVLFTAGNGTVTIELTNLLTASQMKSVGQDLTALYFTVNNSLGNGNSVSSSSGDFITVAGNGSVTQGAAGAMGWVLSNSSKSFTLDDLANGGAGPSNTIIGGTPGSDTAYSNANNSITGNGPHNPFVEGVGEWVLDIPGVTSSTTFSSVKGNFGTTDGADELSFTPSSTTPEPFTVALGLAGIGLFVRRKTAVR